MVFNSKWKEHINGIKYQFHYRIIRVVSTFGKNDLNLLGLIRPFSIFLLKSSPCSNTEMNTAPLSPIVEVADVTITTLFVAANSSRNSVTEHICSVNDTIQRFLPKQCVLA